MAINFTSSQLDKLSELFLDLSKGLFLSAMAFPTLAPTLDIVYSVNAWITGLIFVYFSLKIDQMKGVK